MPFPIDVTELPTRLRETMHRNCTEANAREIEAAKARQTHIAKFHRQFQPKSMDGIGGLTMAIDPFFVNHFAIKNGTHPLEDLDHQKHLLRRNPEFRVKSAGTKLQFGSNGEVRPGGKLTRFGRTTFSKTY